MTLSDSEASERWARAEKAAAGVTDHGTSKAVRTYYLKCLPLEIVLFVGLGVVLAVSGFPFGPEGWAAYLGLGLSLGALVALIGGFIYGIKRVNPMVQPKRANASSLLEKQERKSVRAQMFGRVRPVPERLPIVRGIAAQTRQGLAFQLVVAPGYLFLAYLRCCSQERPAF